MEENPQNAVLSTEEPFKKKRPYWLLSLLLSFGFCFNLFVFAPLESYLSNTAEFWFGIGAVLPTILICFLVGFALCFLLCYLLPVRIKPVLLSLLFSGFLGLYIQGNFLTDGYPSLDGEPIDWAAMTQRGWLNVLMWLVLLTLPLLLMLWKKTIFQTVLKAFSVILIGTQAVTLVTLLIGGGIPAGTDVYLSTEKQFRVSQKGNIVMIVSDTFESPYMARALEEFPELKDDFADFTYYENTTGVSTLTYLSMSTMLTGEIFPADTDLTTGMKACFSKTRLYDVFHENGYDVNLYTDVNFMTSDYLDMIDNLESDSDISNAHTSMTVSKLLYKFSLYKYAPHFMKPRFVLNTAQFGEAMQQGRKPAYVTDDKKFNNQLTESGIQADQDKKQFICYHLNGIHAPNNTDRNLNPIAYPDDVPYNDRRYEQSLGQIGILKNYIQKLKDSGAYDDTTIIYTADHGHQQRYWPVLMIKPAHADGAFRISQAPISMASDLVPFLEELAQGKGDAAALYQIAEDADRERYVYNYVNYGYGKASICRTKVAVHGPAGDAASYHIVQDEFPGDTEPKRAYKPGDSIACKGEPANAVIQGIHNESGRPYSRYANVFLRLDQPAANGLLGTIQVKEILNPNQHVIIRVGERELFNQVVDSTEEPIRFTIPADLTKGPELKLELEFPDTVRSAHDAQILYGITYRSFGLDSFTLTEP